MAHVTADRVLESASGAGTTTLTLAGAVAGFRPFSNALVTGDTCYYTAWEADAQGVPTGVWEVGLATLSASTQLTKNTLLASSTGSFVAFAISGVYAAITSPANKTAYFDNTNAMFVPTATAEPPTPTGGIELYAKELLPQHTVLKVMRPSGVDSPLQDAAAFNRFVKAIGTANTVTSVGGNITFAGTATAITPAAGSPKNQIQRVQYASAATANAVTTHITPAGAIPMFRGSFNGGGGFRYVVRFSLNAVPALANFFVGIADTNSAAGATSPNPLTSTATGKIGLAFTTNTGNFTVVHNVSGTAPTQISLGANYPADITSLYELVLFCRPNNGSTAGDVTYRVRRYTTTGSAAFEATGTMSTNLPNEATVLQPWGYFGNGGTASAAQWHFTSLTVETDF